MVLSDIAYYVEDKISSDEILLEDYITTDNILQNKMGRSIASNMPPTSCFLTHYMPGDVLVSNIRPYLRKIWLADCEGGCNADVLVFRPTVKGNNGYLYAVLMQDSFFDYVMKAPVGSKMPRGEKRHIMRYPVFQKISGVNSICHFLSNIDKKIAINRRINESLEGMAKLLYDYWFVQFDFPNEEGKPYKSSGGKMVWNEKLKREIPEGWEVKNINELSKSDRGVTYDKSEIVNKRSGILVLRGNNIQNNHIVYDSNEVYVPQNLVSENQKIKKNDIVMTMSSGSKEHIGKCIMFQEDSDHTFGAFLNKFSPYRYPHLLFLFFISDYFKTKIQKICSGTGINNLTNKTFDNIFIAIPYNQIILNTFELIIAKQYEEYGLNEKETNSLTSLRDFLLPMLMNGQVEIKEK